MNEVKLGHYSVDARKVSIDLSGRYNTLTIRSDVKNWLEESYAELFVEYEKKYHIKCFAHFLSYFLINLFESKFDAQRNVIRLKESDFGWLQKEYQKHRKNTKKDSEITSFERFADSYINELLQKIKTAKEILSV